MADLSWQGIKRHFRFDEEEIRSFALMALVFAFILSFDEWGVDAFDAGLGLKNFIVALIVVTASLLIHDSAHRLYAIRMGYQAKLRIWWAGLALVAAICFITNGAVKLFVGASTWFVMVKERRLGKSMIESPKDHAYLSLAGPIASVLFAGMMRMVGEWLPANTHTINNLVYFNLVFGVLSFLPIPPLDGSRFFFHARNPYVFILATLVSYAILHVLGVPSMIVALLFGLAAMLVWMYKVEGEIKKS